LTFFSKIITIAAYFQGACCIYKDTCYFKG
jgi:hypothetical protein